MSSPWPESLCGICFGPYSPETVFTDENNTHWDLHKGLCAYLAGEVPPEHRERNNELVEAVKAAESGSQASAQARREYYDWLDSLNLEDHGKD